MNSRSSIDDASGILGQLRELDAVFLEELHEKLVRVANPDTPSCPRKANGNTLVSICLLGDVSSPRFDLLDRILDSKRSLSALSNTVTPSSLPPLLAHFVTYGNDPDESGIRYEEWADYDAPCALLTEAEFLDQIGRPAPYGKARRFRIAARFIEDAGRVDWILPPPGIPGDLESLATETYLPSATNTRPALVPVAESETAAVQAWMTLRELTMKAALGAPVLACCRAEPSSLSEDVPVYGLSEAADEIVSRCKNTSTWFPSPEQRKKALERSIYGAWQAANAVVHQRNSGHTKKQDVQEFLEECELEWRKMFLDERRFAIDSLRLEVVAHHLQRSALILPGERSRIVEHYAREQLLPRLDLFLRKQSLRLKRLAGTRVSSTAAPGGLISTGHVEARLWLHATIASLPVAGMQLAGLAGWSMPGDGMGLINGGLSLAPVPELHGLARFNPVELAKVAGREAAGHVANELTPYMQLAIDINSAILSVLVWSQIGAVVALAIQGVLQVYSGISVREAEKMICRLLGDCESKWPHIRAAMEDAAGITNALGMNDESVAKADKILRAIGEVLKADSTFR